MEFKVDYHIHSWYSDGALSPAKLIKKYKDEGYDEISITDHDGIGGVEEAMTAGKDYKIQVIPGIEFSTEYKGLDLHLLGYKFDIKNEALNNRLEEIRLWRRERNIRLLQTLSEMGYEMTIEELEGESEKGYVGKPNIARLMVKKGYISSPKEAFQSGKMLTSPEVKAVKKVKIDTVEAIKLILNAGGIPVLAHPIKIKGIGDTTTDEYWTNVDKLVRELKIQGLKGLEVFYATNTEEESEKFRAMAGKYHLHMTTGSDYHGDDMK